MTADQADKRLAYSHHLTPHEDRHGAVVEVELKRERVPILRNVREFVNLSSVRIRTHIATIVVRVDIANARASERLALRTIKGF